MHARSALFDLYGDHLRARGGRAPVASLVRLLAPLQIQAPAVRTAVSRMVRQGWLQAVRLPEGRGYGLTARAERRLDEAAARIYRTRETGWDGRWHLVVVGAQKERGARDRVRAAMSYLGYACLDGGTWVGPRRSPEVEAILEGEAASAQQFTARHDGDSTALAHRLWDLDALAAAYRRWLDDAEALVATVGPDPGDEQAFAVRSRLVHEWRKFLFRDPGLPGELLPAGWVGEKAAAFFDDEARRLLPAATRFVSSCLTPTREEHP